MKTHTRDSIVQALAASDLPMREELIRQLRPAILCESTPSERPLTDQQGLIGASRVGGLPDMPPELEWPYWRDTRLLFYCQLNLADVPNVADRALLPPDGMLYFFAHETVVGGVEPPFDRGSAAGLYSKTPGDALRTPPPRLRPGEWKRLTIEDITGGTMTTESWMRIRVFGRPPTGFWNLSPEEAARPADELNWKVFQLKFEEMWTVPLGFLETISRQECREASRLLDSLYRRFDIAYELKNQMFGWPDSSGQEEWVDCERRRRGLLWAAAKSPELREELERAQEEWVLLLALTSEDDRGGPAIGDVGTLYFFARRDDLARGDFSKVQAAKFSH